MSNEFKIEKLNNRLVKYADNNANGKCDKGEELASIDFSDSKGAGKFDKFKMGGNVSLFSTDEVAKDLEGRAFETSSEALPQDGKGNFKVNTNNEYSVGALKNYLTDSKKNEYTTNVVKDTKTVTTIRPNMDQYHKDVAAAYTPVVSTLQGDGTAFTQSTTQLMEDLLTFMDVTVQAERRTTVSEKTKTDETGKGGFVLDADSANKPVENANVAPVAAAAAPAVAEAPAAPVAASAPAPKANGAEGAEGVDKKKLDDCLDLELVDRAGYKASSPEHDLVIDFKDDQWISKVAIAVYGEQNEELNKAIADMNGLKNPNIVKINSKLNFPKVIEINGRSYNAKSCDKSEEEYQADADRIKNEITAPSFGSATGAGKNKDVDTNADSTANGGTTTQAAGNGSNTSDAAKDKNKDNETNCTDSQAKGTTFGEKLKYVALGAGTVMAAPFVVNSFVLSSAAVAATGYALAPKKSSEELKDEAKKHEAMARAYEFENIKAKKNGKLSPYVEASNNGKAQAERNKAAKLRKEAAGGGSSISNAFKAEYKKAKYELGLELGEVVQGVADSKSGQKGLAKAGEVIAENPKTTDLVLKNTAKSQELGGVVAAGIPMSIDELNKPENQAKINAMVNKIVNDPVVMDRIAKEALKAAKGNSKDMAGLLKDMLEGSNKEVLRGAFKQVASDVLSSDNAQMIDKITEMAMQNVVKKVLNDKKYVSAIGVTYDKIMKDQNAAVQWAAGRPDDAQAKDLEEVKKAGLLK